MSISLSRQEQVDAYDPQRSARRADVQLALEAGFSRKEIKFMLDLPDDALPDTTNTADGFPKKS